MNESQIKAIGFGEVKPIANNETTEGRARNRRIDIVIYPEDHHAGMVSGTDVP
jgi:chemotaxis protein MotB